MYPGLEDDADSAFNQQSSWVPSLYLCCEAYCVKSPHYFLLVYSKVLLERSAPSNAPVGHILLTMRLPWWPRWTLAALVLCVAAAAAAGDNGAPPAGAGAEGAAAPPALVKPTGAPPADDDVMADVEADAIGLPRGRRWSSIGEMLGDIPRHMGGGDLPPWLDSAHGGPALPPGLEEMLASLESGLGGARHHVMHLPAVFNTVLGEIMNEGLAGALGPKNVEFSFRDERKVLVVKLNMPAAHGGQGDTARVQMSRRMIHMAVVGGGSRLRVRVETLNLGADMIFEHTIQLPVLVTQEGIETVANPDGSATAMLKVIGELPEVGGDDGSHPSPPGHRLPFQEFLFGQQYGRAGLAEVSNDGDQNGTAVSQTLPSAADVQACRLKYPGREYKLNARHCVCRASPTADGRAVCFAGVLSSAINIARRVGKGSKASEYKHGAIECAGHADGHSHCLERLCTGLLKVIYGDIDHGHVRKLSDRIRTAIESEDVLESEERPSPSVTITVLLVGFVLIPCLALTMLYFLWRRLATNGAGGSTKGSHNGLSSVLSQRPMLDGKRRSTSGKIA